MAAGIDSYSRLVNWLKVVLPLLALAILSSLFLLSRTIDPSQAIPFAEVDVEELAREPRVSAPNYAGMTDDGAALAITAATATPDIANPGRASAVDLRAVIETTDNVTTTITSATGQIDTGAGTLVLRGAVNLASSLGYRVDADQMTALLDRTRVETNGPMQAAGPFGTITAGSMVLSQSPDGTGRYVLVFKGGVNLLYDPKG